MTHTTALHVAVQNNDLKIIELLVRDGASIDTRQPDGKTPLLIAVENRNHGMIQLLLKLGANKSLEDTEGSTAIDLAEGHSTIIALLEAPQEI
ncbi:ankyrin repeat-containing domain protein [Truncatella angustata]|uniref:Ankyrin repeat-containing domain protein n=1 Tax=Truncatella angustata TaxID=152316 RepID=A0A9P8RH66_9PEZI|nr:ankyrin repeat-containing domain protein [Truncatella angustata]KAH6645948.1 ankyrin repeat-containing domain protein [Truncatella angustata]